MRFARRRDAGLDVLTQDRQESDEPIRREFGDFVRKQSRHARLVHADLLDDRHLRKLFRFDDFADLSNQQRPQNEIVGFSRPNAWNADLRETVTVSVSFGLRMRAISGVP